MVLSNSSNFPEEIVSGEDPYLCQALELAQGLEVAAKNAKESHVRSREALPASGRQEMYALMPPASRRSLLERRSPTEDNVIVVARWVIHIASVMGVARRDTCKKFAVTSQQQNLVIGNCQVKVEKLYTVWKRV